VAAAAIGADLGRSCGVWDWRVEFQIGLEEKRPPTVDLSVLQYYRCIIAILAYGFNYRFCNLLNVLCQFWLMASVISFAIGLWFQLSTLQFYRCLIAM
jgi:hypothetical protein